MKQRVDDLERMLQTVAAAIKERSTALADTRRLVGRLECTLRGTCKSLNDVRAHDLMKRQLVDVVDLFSRVDEHRRHIEVSRSAPCNPWPHVANRRISISQLLSLRRHSHYDVSRLRRSQPPFLLHFA